MRYFKKRSHASRSLLDLPKIDIDYEENITEKKFR